MAYEVQKTILVDLKCKLPKLSTIIYFTDGCTGQYKKRKNFYKFCHHKSCFGLNARWVFFATSHVIGGTVKRLVSNASLKRDLENQILSLGDMFQFCKENIQNVSSNFFPRLMLITQG